MIILAVNHSSSDGMNNFDGDENIQHSVLVSYHGGLTQNMSYRFFNAKTSICTDVTREVWSKRI